MTPSVRPDNRFRLKCPVVGREERYLACVLRKFKKWRGEPLDCGGCAAAMDANKCPVVHMIELEVPRHGSSRSIFFDATGDKLYGLPKPVADRIERVIIMPFHARRYAMPPEMYERLTGQPVGAIRAVPAPSTAEEKSETPTRRQVRRESAMGTKPKDDLTGILANAKTDMAAAINAAG